MHSGWLSPDTESWEGGPGHACLGKAGRRAEAGDLVWAAEARQPGMEGSPGEEGRSAPALLFLGQRLQYEEMLPLVSEFLFARFPFTP